MTGSRGDSAGILSIGVATAAAYLWFRYPVLLIAGSLLALDGAVSLAADLRRGQAWHEQDVMLRKPWTAVKRIPSGHVLTDPETSELLTVERERGWLTLAVTDPPQPGAEAAVCRYPLGKWAAPEQPPLFRHITGLDDSPPARWRWRQQAALLEFNSRTGAAGATAAELAALLDQVNRAWAVDLRGARHAGG